LPLCKKIPQILLEKIIPISYLSFYIKKGKKMKKITQLAFGLSLTSLTLCADSFSDVPSDTDQEPKNYSHTDLFLSSPTHTFQAEGRALLLQPVDTNLNYAAEADPLPLTSPEWSIHDINTNYHFAFDVGLKGILHSTNTVIALNWEHFRSSDSSSTTLVSGNMIGPFFEIGADATPYTESFGRAKFYFDEASLSYGIFVNLGSRLSTTLTAGVGFARIKQDLFSQFSNASGTILRSITTPSTFLGAGPQFGVDFSYKIVKGFQFTGGVLASLFVGPQKNKTTFQSYAPALADLDITPPNVQYTETPNRTQVIPGFKGKLGLAYAHTFKKHYLIKFEVGYEAQIYFNAIQSTNIGSEVNTPPIEPDTVGVFARTFAQRLSNFSLAGPYCALTFGF
jgi:hypothetical protein